MKEAIQITLGITLLMSLIFGFIFGLTSLIYYTPTNITEFYKDTNTVCREEKKWGFQETTKYCLQGVAIPESDTQTVNINLN